MAELAVKTEALSKSFGTIKAVDSIDLAVEKGRIFGLVGPDGAGKTTTLRLLTTLLKPTSGRAIIAGFDSVRQEREIRNRIGYISEKFNLYGDLTVVENLYFFARLHQIPTGQRDEVAEKLLSFSRLEDFRDRRSEFLSGGMKKKLALACALIQEPEILFLDEPTTGVDPVSRRDFWNILSELRSSGVTLFITTPYMDEAERCNSVAFMQNGRIRMSGTPAEIKELIKEELVEIITDRPAKLIETVRRLPQVISAEMFGERIEAVLADDKGGLPGLKKSLKQEGLGRLKIESKRPSMESAFVYLTKSEEELDEEH